MYKPSSAESRSMGSLIGRKDFLLRTGLLIGAGVFSSVGFRSSSAYNDFRQSYDLNNWEDIRASFRLDKNLIHMAHFFLTSHPKPVSDAIEMHRKNFDLNPVEYYFEAEERSEAAVLNAAAEYMGVEPVNIALTDSTTMGLGLLYSGLRMKPGQEILTTFHDHYATDMSLQHRADRMGNTVRKISLYRDIGSVSKEEIVETLVKNINDKTRVVAVTWVHSSTGLKLPITMMSEAIAAINRNRDKDDKVLFCVDGVHGFGIEDTPVAALGCDFFVSGTHKWIFGPRGTGLVYGKPEAWEFATPSIPTFHMDSYLVWMKINEPHRIEPGYMNTPGGFHSFEHRWALDQAFLFHKAIGRAKIMERIHSMNFRIKQAMKEMKHIKLITPLSQELSSGIICYESAKYEPFNVVEELRRHNIVSSVTPYAKLYGRVSASLVNNDDEISAVIKALRSLA